VQTSQKKKNTGEWFTTSKIQAGMVYYYKNSGTFEGEKNLPKKVLPLVPSLSIV